MAENKKEVKEMVVRINQDVIDRKINLHQKFCDYANQLIELAKKEVSPLGIDLTPELLLELLRPGQTLKSNNGLGLEARTFGIKILELIIEKQNANQVLSINYERAVKMYDAPKFTRDFANLVQSCIYTIKNASSFNSIKIENFEVAKGKIVITQAAKDGIKRQNSETINDPAEIKAFTQLQRIAGELTKILGDLYKGTYIDIERVLATNLKDGKLSVEALSTSIPSISGRKIAALATNTQPTAGEMGKFSGMANPEIAENILELNQNIGKSSDGPKTLIF